MGSDIPELGAVFWPVGTGDSTTVVISDSVVMQIDLHDMAKADDEGTPEVPVVDLLVEALPEVNGRPYLAVFALTHADQDHCRGFGDLLDKVTIGELWATPRLWREYEEDDGEALCPDARKFQEEVVRRVDAVKKAVKEGYEPAAGDRIMVFGYDTDRDKHAYSELPDKYLSGPGKSLTTLDGEDFDGRFEAFIHAPFRDDCAAARNDTSLAMQVTLTDDSGQEGRMLLLGDLAYVTIMKIFDYSEYHDREEYLEWDLLLAPHHCSKKVMYVPDKNGKDVLQTDVMDAFSRHASAEPVVVSSSAVIPAKDESRKNPPHRKAANRYQDIADEFICTMSWLDANAPSPVVFAVDSTGAHIVREDTVKLTVEAMSTKVLRPAARRLAAVTAAASVAAAAVATHTAQAATGPERLREAIATDRGGEKAPSTAVGFGR